MNMLGVVKDDICEQAHSLRRPQYTFLLTSTNVGVGKVTAACDLTTG